jgi:DNA-binding NarL/FixJ family response regulator
VSTEAHPSSATPIRVAVIEDDRATREGLKQLIDLAAGYQCTGTFDSVEAAIAPMAADSPDVLLLDINLPGIQGSEGVALVKRRLPSVDVLMLTIYTEQDRVFESICNGACGYLLKNTRPERLLQCIKEVHEGGAPMSPEIARQVISVFHRPRSSSGLTPHETRILGLLAEGHSYHAIGVCLNVTVNTVRNYIRSIYMKLQVHSKSEAVSKALRERLIR